MLMGLLAIAMGLVTLRTGWILPRRAATSPGPISTASVAC